MKSNNPSPQVSQWYAWLGLTISTFAILERRALRKQEAASQESVMQATLSYVLRSHTRHSTHRKVAGVTAMTGFCTWFAWHILFQPLDENGFSAPLRKSNTKI